MRFALAILLSLCAALEVENWLDDPEAPLLSSAHLISYVPKPAKKASTYAYARFSLVPAIARMFKREPRDGAAEPLLSSEQLEIDDHYKLGETYLWGTGGVRNLTLAVEHFRIAGLEQGDPDALFRLGFAYSTGLLGAVDEDQAKASLFYHLAAEAGSIEAQITMGHRYKHGLHVPVDLDRALEYYRGVGDRFLALQLEAHDAEGAYFTKTSKRSWAFGAETATGLYGKHSYRKIVTPAVRSIVPLGEQSSAWQFILAIYRDEFNNLSDAVDTLVYRAEEEEDTRAMYALARIFAAGIRFEDPQTNWRLAAEYAQMCIATSAAQSPLLQSHSNLKVVYSLCAEFLAERHLHGGEGVPLDFALAGLLYEKAISLRKDLSRDWSQCRSCVSGLALIEWRKQGSPLHGANNVTTALLRNAFDQSHISNDYTLPVVLARMYMANNDTRARWVLRRIVADTAYGRAPIAALLMAQVDNPEKRLDRYVEGVYGSEELVSPMWFAHYSYLQGDLDSAMLGFLLAAELGVPAAALNLADLLDTRHSYVGTKLKWKWLRRITEWPLPRFVDASRREEFAFKYFMLAAKLDSVDGLMKAVEYDVAPAALNLQYLYILAEHGFGMAHWYLGHYYETVRRNFKQAALHYRRALGTPEAWIPVKLSQLKLYYKTLGEHLPEKSSNLKLPWRKAVQMYHSAFSRSVEVAEISDEDDARTARAAGGADAAVPRLAISFSDTTNVEHDSDYIVLEVDMVYLAAMIGAAIALLYVVPRVFTAITRWRRRRRANDPAEIQRRLEALSRAAQEMREHRLRRETEARETEARETQQSEDREDQLRAEADARLESQQRSRSDEPQSAAEAEPAAQTSSGTARQPIAHEGDGALLVRDNNTPPSA